MSESRITVLIPGSPDGWLWTGTLSGLVPTTPDHLRAAGWVPASEVEAAKRRAVEYMRMRTSHLPGSFGMSTDLILQSMEADERRHVASTSEQPEERP